jgi:hypothetical protein
LHALLKDHTPGSLWKSFTDVDASFCTPAYDTISAVSENEILEHVLKKWQLGEKHEAFPVQRNLRTL